MDNTPLTRYLGALSKREQLFVDNILPFSTTQSSKIHHPPGVPWKWFLKNKKKLTLKKLLIYDFLCVTVWRICFPLYKYSLILENSQNIAFPSQVKKISFGVHIFFLLLYTLTYYTFCAWWEIKIFSQFYLDIVLPPSCNLFNFEIIVICQIIN